MTRSKAPAGGAASRARSASGCSRRSQPATALRKEASAMRRACAARRSSASSVPSTYSPASPSISSPSATEAILQYDQASPEERLDRRDRPLEALGELLAAPAVAVGEEHHAAPV